MCFRVSRVSLRVALSVVEACRLGLTCPCSLTSPSAVSESCLSVSDAQLLRLLALGVVGFVDCFGRVVCMWVAGLAWFEFACVGDSLESCVILWLLGGGILGGRCALSASPMPLAYILVRRRDLISV